MTNREFFLQQMEQQLTPFIRVFEALPDEAQDYRPHPESRSAKELVGHMLAEIQGLEELTSSGKLTMPAMTPFGSFEDAVASFRQAYEATMSHAKHLRDGEWDEGMCELNFGLGKTQAMPTMKAAWIFLLDMIHHRGQLSTYIRPMGGKIEAIFG